MSAVLVEYSTLLALECPCVASRQANKALHFTFSLRLADIVSNHDMKRLIEALSVSLDLDVHVLPVALDGLKVPNSLQGWFWASLDPPPAAGRGFEVTQGLVGW